MLNLSSNPSRSEEEFRVLRPKGETLQPSFPLRRCHPPFPVKFPLASDPQPGTHVLSSIPGAHASLPEAAAPLSRYRKPEGKTGRRHLIQGAKIPGQSPARASPPPSPSQRTRPGMRL